MCGIVGYLGHREAFDVIVKGLQRLEYRGYDSAGLMLFDGDQVTVSKTKGKVFDLKEKAEKANAYGLFQWHRESRRLFLPFLCLNLYDV